jgi:hypothetical protein|tara:strand:- start:1743 stop:1892 length:150 start_codon:yes stop_codon:yes gene_type:complete
MRDGDEDQPTAVLSQQSHLVGSGMLSGEYNVGFSFTSWSVVEQQWLTRP